MPVSKTGEWREELAWAAGLFDGEGSIGTYHHPRGVGRCATKISISQKKPHVLARFALAIETPRVPTLITRNDGRGIYVWQIQGFESCQYIVALLWFKLSVPKRRQAKEALLKYITAYREASCQ